MALKDEIERRVLAAEQGQRSRYAGPDWWQLSPEEELVFGIDRHRWPHLMTAWSLYGNFLGIADEGESEELAKMLEGGAASTKIFSIRECARAASRHLQGNTPGCPCAKRMPPIPRWPFGISGQAPRPTAMNTHKRCVS